MTSSRASLLRALAERKSVFEFGPGLFDGVLGHKHFEFPRSNATVVKASGHLSRLCVKDGPGCRGSTTPQ